MGGWVSRLRWCAVSGTRRTVLSASLAHPLSSLSWLSQLPSAGSVHCVSPLQRHGTIVSIGGMASQARWGRGDPHRGGGESPACCRRMTLGSRSQLARVPDASAQAVSEGLIRQCEHSGAAAAHPRFGQTSLFCFFACEALRTLFVPLLYVPVPLALDCICVTRCLHFNERLEQRLAGTLCFVSLNVSSVYAQVDGSVLAA